MPIHTQFIIFECHLGLKNNNWKSGARFLTLSINSSAVTVSLPCNRMLNNNFTKRFEAAISVL